MSNRSILSFKAGTGAYARIRKDGFDIDRIGSIAGASGGAKWLVLSQIDRVIAHRVLPGLKAPVHLVGSSIGAWRFCCYAQDDPIAAIDRFEDAYLNQQYSASPDRQEISRKSREILQTILGQNGAREILRHPVLRTNVMTVRSRFLAGSEWPSVLGAGLLLSAAANAVSRRTLGLMFSRSLFYDSRDLPPFYNARGFPMDRIELTESNLEDVVLATGSIPLVLSGIPDIKGAPRGIYRDGGIIDYHLDLQTSSEGQLTLFPHFFDRLVPGWFDKKLPWRRHSPINTERTVLICPSADFISRLPNGKVPDRTDFQSMSPELRRKVWMSVVDSCKALAETLNDVLDKDLLPAHLEPL